MTGIPVTSLIPTLQTAIGPMILISGVGLLVLSMTNRLAHLIDRTRILVAQLPGAGEEARSVIEGQLCILWQRAHLIRAAIALVALSALAAALLIIVLFATALWQLATEWLIVALFVGCMGCLIGSLILFLHDINRSLLALKIELEAGGMKDL
jgi:hypothetical protein